MMITNTHNLKITYIKSLSLRKDLIGVQDELLRFAYKPTISREETNDLLQETSLKALDNEDRYTPDTNFKGWMYTITWNISIGNYRKVVRDQTFVDQTESLYYLNLPQDSGFESTERAYDLKEIHCIVSALLKEYGVPFAMYVSGLKYREIAEKLNLPLGTVKSRIFFICQKLQGELKDLHQTSTINFQLVSIGTGQKDLVSFCPLYFMCWRFVFAMGIFSVTLSLFNWLL